MVMNKNVRSCVLNWSNVISLANKRKSKTLMDIQDFLNFLTICFIVVMIFFYRKSILKITKDVDSNELTANDYTAMV